MESHAETDRNSCTDFSGIPFLFAGDEIMRDRRGNGNPYNASDEINAIDWQKKTQNRDVFDYVRN